MKAIVTGGAGFIGSHLVDLLVKKGWEVYVIDSLTYAAREESINKSAKFLWLDICSVGLFEDIKTIQPDVIFHLAAETHVDNSIVGPQEFIDTNIVGTFNLLETVRKLGKKVRLVHVSTDEVFGDLKKGDKPFKETDPYKPSSPYSASKASSDLLVKSYVRTYGIDAIVTNCSNNFGPRQHAEKLIPTVIECLKNDKEIPVYGSGQNIRDWIYVEDHCEALHFLFEKGTSGESYNIGGECELTNLQIIDYLGKIMERSPKIEFVKDRAGHDYRYAIDNSKIKSLGWINRGRFESDLRYTVHYFL
jgi:dTDP-glucose 4,6-dehydratase